MSNIIYYYFNGIFRTLSRLVLSIHASPLPPPRAFLDTLSDNYVGIRNLR